MTQSPAVPPTGRSGPVRIGERAARALVSELTRINEPKAALLVDTSPESPVLAAAIEALLPGDTLTVVPAGWSDDGMLREHLAAQGPWVAERIRVVAALAEAEAAAVAIIGEPLTGTVGETRATLDGLRKHLDNGATLSVATPAITRCTGGASDELDRQAALHGVGSDLLLRNNPPLRVHRLRFSPANAAAAVEMAPAYRPSSVPLTRTMHIDSNGVAAAGIALGLAAVARAARPTSKLWLLPALAAAPVAAFFRDPEREVPADPSAVVASADGKVLSVQRLSDERFGDGEWLRIAVFLSVLDVHVNRSPVAGKVVDYFVTDGGFANAMKPDAEHNVAAYTVLDTINGTVIVAQRTGLIARRIVQRAPIGSLLAKGERFGLIRFGSRTDVYLPADAAQPLVGPGDRVVGGSSVIARWH
ncbi:phosphatidylserine decarboxylase [Salinispora cortesiana]|uniref:phosphatidylserine decarboxylase n=1 Tax=Salinispora cortesiana TaxID=1305843 RepID=UPI00040DDCA4|nr:phosphatidylserine decarboxylase [Salinispora cortesiana]